VPGQLRAAGVPDRIAAAFGASIDLGSLRGAGSDLGQRILAAVPDAYRAAVEPLVPRIIAGIGEAISVSVAATFVFAAAMTVLGLAAVLALPDGTGAADRAHSQAAGAASRSRGTRPGVALD
jgi:hypothetical protein